MTISSEPPSEHGGPSDTEVQCFKQLVQINRTLIIIKKILLVFLAVLVLVVAGVALALLLAPTVLSLD